MPETIPTTFDPVELPDWARVDPDIVAVCRRDLAYRCLVYRAETAQYRRVLAREAHQREDARALINR